MLAASLSPVANGGSRVFWGWASDKIGRETSMVVAFTLQGDLPVPRARRRPDLGLVVRGHAGAVVYFTWGEIYSLFPAITADYFGTRHATSNYAVVYTAKGVASGVGGWVGALMFEQFGTWAVPFYGGAAMALAAGGPGRRPARQGTCSARRDGAHGVVAAAAK